ncbi:DUF1778 domain-containing protein [Streptococcus iniae]|uniref:DUF6744 family protein n=1 Tax=Streptococcus dysgalactiae TaxID=1334 RepID=UPI002A0DAAD5|nr:DUF1778 domain-containing protein [Streptococcus iniae]
MAQINIRVTDEQKSLINSLSKKEGKTISAYILDRVCVESVNQDNDVVSLLKEQLDKKDEQINNLHQIIYNKDTKLLEYDSKKSWWHFWK